MPQASASDLGGCGLPKRAPDPAKTQAGKEGGLELHPSPRPRAGTRRFPKMTGDARRGNEGDGVDLGVIRVLDSRGAGVGSFAPSGAAGTRRGSSSRGLKKQKDRNKSTWMVIKSAHTWTLRASQRDRRDGEKGSWGLSLTLAFE